MALCFCAAVCSSSHQAAAQQELEYTHIIYNRYKTNKQNFCHYCFYLQIRKHVLIYAERREDMDKYHIWTHFTTTWITDVICFMWVNLKGKETCTHTFTHTQLLIFIYFISLIKFQEKCFSVWHIFPVSQLSVSHSALCNDNNRV